MDRLPELTRNLEQEYKARHTKEAEA